MRRHMSEEDLKDLGAFFNSPVGKRYVAFEPVIVTNIDDAMKGWTQGGLRRHDGSRAARK